MIVNLAITVGIWVSTALSEPPEYPVCKKFLDDLLSLIKELEIDICTFWWAGLC